MAFLLNKNLSRQWSRIGPRGIYGQSLLELAKENKNLFAISADLGNSSGLDRYKQSFPDRFINIGIAEQNLIGFASGLSTLGFNVFVSSFAPFITMRACEQVRLNLGYMQSNVKIVAIGSGLSMGFLGNSHFGLEDIAIMRTIPNLNITCPADCSELGKVLSDYAFNDRGPSYIRLTGIPGSQNVYNKNYTYKFGKNITITKGKDILILSHGSILGQVKLSVNALKKLNIDAELVNVVSLKPIDESVIRLFKKYKKIITIEEHTSVGGLGSIMAEKILKNGIKSRLFSISLEDKFGPTGNYEYLLKHHGLDNYSITKKIIKLVKKK